MTTDIVIDTLDTLLGLLQQHGTQDLQALRGQAERIVRSAWGGERAYVAKLGEDGQRQLSRRDQAIRRDWAHGDHVPLLARRYGLSERRVYAIVQGERAGSAAPCLTDGTPAAQHAEHAPDRADHRAAAPDRRRHRVVAPQRP